MQELHKSEIGKLRNGYQKEIEAAIRRAETAEQQSKEKDAVIDRQRKRIAQLDRNANPQRYSLSSGAELVRINVSNYRNPSLHIWTKVGEELFEDTKFQIDYDVAQKHFNGQITDEEFVNAVFEPQEQVSGKQAELLGAAFTLAAEDRRRFMLVLVEAVLLLNFRGEIKINTPRNKQPQDDD